MLIISILPEYIEGIGDCCRVKRKSGEELYEKKLNTVFREIFRNNFLDYSAIKKKTANILKQKTLVPVYLSSKEILIPVKVRQPLFKGDCSYGYVSVFEIKKIFNKEILLKNGEKIAFIGTKRAIQKREFLAELLAEKLPDMVKPNFANGGSLVGADIFGSHFLKLLQQISACYGIGEYVRHRDGDADDDDDDDDDGDGKRCSDHHSNGNSKGNGNSNNKS